MIDLLVWVVVGIIVVAFLWWASGLLPAPFQKFAQLIIGLFAVIFLIYLAYSIYGGWPQHHPPLRRLP